MPCYPPVHDTDPCILEGIRPFLAELQAPVTLQVVNPEHRKRPAVEQFIHEVFQSTYGANIQSFYPTLLSFCSDAEQRAAVGYRDGSVRPLFSEQYLPQPAHEMIGTYTGETIERNQMVEVGNLALASAGEARWVIAAVTLYLYELGYRWVLFTAVKPLFNAFQRLGLNPIQLAEANAGLLPDKGKCWGRYYDARPVVCVGNIESGYRKLRQHVSPHQPTLHAVLNEVSRQAALARTVPQSMHGGL
jgi:hypothetical protein